VAWSQRPTAHLVIDVWTSLDTAKVWTPPDDPVHVLGIASQEEDAPEEVTVALGPPALDAVGEVLGRFGAASFAARVGAIHLHSSILSSTFRRGSWPNLSSQQTLTQGRLSAGPC
jgi:hypothetical protein